MKGKITFDFENSHDFEMLSQMYDKSMLVDDALEEIRKLLKYTDVSKETEEILEKLRSILTDRSY